MIGDRLVWARRFALAAALFVVAGAFGSFASSRVVADEAAPAVGSEHAAADQLTIVSGTGRHVFHIEIADDDAERAKGLMFRRSLVADYGMLFDFQRTRPVYFWMKNTYVSLDMIFIRADGTIATIAKDTVPESERIVPSGTPVRFVFEVVAGTTARLGIRPGDRIEHPLVDAAK
ncbi:MAG: hypothetical protein C0606_03540 [Hyphomicrobiales bacterium]|nr:MAG: hypothetical protein C0606_03540 [Hyphomicrobiales bacterium]